MNIQIIFISTRWWTYRLTSRSFKWLSNTSSNHFLFTGLSRNVETIFRCNPITDWSFINVIISLHTSGLILSVYRLTYVSPRNDSVCKFDSTHFSTALLDPMLKTWPWYSVYTGDKNMAVSVSEQMLSEHLL